MKEEGLWRILRSELWWWLMFLMKCEGRSFNWFVIFFVVVFWSFFLWIVILLMLFCFWSGVLNCLCLCFWILEVFMLLKLCWKLLCLFYKVVMFGVKNGILLWSVFFWEFVRWVDVIGFRIFRVWVLGFRRFDLFYNFFLFGNRWRC